MLATTARQFNDHMDERVMQLLTRAQEVAGNPNKLRDVESRLRGLAASQSLGRGFGGAMSPDQERIAEQAARAAGVVKEMIEAE